jgi:epoxide hydrolase-like predicted phosphatase
MIKAVIFDCYGVLYPDTFWTLASEYLGEGLQQKRPELHDLIRRADMGQIDRGTLWQSFAELVGRDYMAVQERLKQFTGLDKRLLTLIEELKPNFKIGMISNVGQGFIERMFVDEPASHYFDDLVLSSSVGMIKPDKRIYEIAAERLGVDPSECVFVDDLEKNVVGAQEAGMQAIRYKDYHQAVKELRQLINVSNTNK